MLSVAVFACFFVYFLAQENQSGSQRVHEGVSGDADRIIMYSLSTCGYCKQKVKELRQRNIAFTEYFIDKDSSRLDELNSKLAKAGFSPRSFGTPIMDVYGVMLPNNPSMDVIQQHLNKYQPRDSGSTELSTFNG